MSATEPTPGAESPGSGAPEDLLPSGETEVPPLRQTTPTNPQAAPLNFPEHVPEAVKTAIIGFKPPAERAIVTLEGGKNVNRSIINFYGVRLELLPLQEGRRKQEWACLASQACRASGKRLKIFSCHTSGATAHLKDMHGIGGATSAKSTKRYIQQSQADVCAGCVVAYQSGRAREHACVAVDDVIVLFGRTKRTRSLLYTQPLHMRTGSALLVRQDSPLSVCAVAVPNTGNTMS